jgi:hypothetical protein
LGLSVLGGSALAGGTNTNIGFVFANCPKCTSSYVPEAGYSWNSSGGAVSIVRTSMGQYSVDFAGLSNPLHLNNVQISAYATSGYCVSTGWDSVGPGGAAEMYVACYDKNGALADTKFDLLYQQRTKPFGSAAKGMAFLWADQPTAASYAPDSNYSFNSTGGSNSIVRNSTGNYTATLAGVMSENNNVQVTANGSVPARCKVLYSLVDLNNTNVTVLCVDATGAPVDSQFNLLYAAGQAFDSDGSSTVGAYAWANKTTTKTAYPINSLYRYNGFGTGALTSQRTGAGAYTFTIPGSPSYASSNVLVTAQGSNSDYCNIVSWTRATANLACYAQGGTHANDAYNIGFQTW